MPISLKYLAAPGCIGVVIPSRLSLIHICARVTEIDNIPRPLAYYRRNPAGITSRHGNYANQRLLAGVGRELARLLPDVDDAALRFHAEVGHGSGMRSRDELKRARDWICLLYTSRCV